MFWILVLMCVKSLYQYLNLKNMLQKCRSVFMPFPQSPPQPHPMPPLPLWAQLNLTLSHNDSSLRYLRLNDGPALRFLLAHYRRWDVSLRRWNLIPIQSASRWFQRQPSRFQRGAVWFFITSRAVRVNYQCRRAWQCKTSAGQGGFKVISNIQLLFLFCFILFFLISKCHIRKTALMVMYSNHTNKQRQTGKREDQYKVPTMQRPFHWS